MKIQRSFIVGCVLAIFLMLCPMPELNRFLRYGMDLLHAPFFALLAFFLDQKRRKHPQGMSAPVLWTLLLLLGLLLESVQMWFGRDSNWHDGLSNVLGIFAGLFISSAQCSTTTAGKLSGHLIALCLIAVASFPGARGVWDALEARRMFPQLANFESSSELLRWKAREAKLTRSRKHTIEGEFAGRLALRPGRYPGASLELPQMTWREKDSLTFGVTWNPDLSQRQTDVSPTLRLHLKLEDRGPSELSADRFETTVLVKPGKNKFYIPIDDIRHGPIQRTLDLNEMVLFSIFVTNLEESTLLFLDDIQLE